MHFWYYMCFSYLFCRFLRRFLQHRVYHDLINKTFLFTVIMQMIRSFWVEKHNRKSCTRSQICQATSLTRPFGFCIFEFRFSSHLCQLWLIRDLPFVSSGGNRSTRRKPPPNSKSLATFPHVQAGIRTQAVVRDSVQSVAAP